jgi:hypothetical protein
MTPGGSVPILLATIEHSGTFRTLELLGWPARGVCPVEEAHLAKPGQILFAHLYDKVMDSIMEHARSLPLMTTYRPVEAIRQSWINRGRDLKELEPQLANYRRLASLQPYVIHLGRPS